MKRRLLSLFCGLTIALLMTSCYTYSFSVGDGSQIGHQIIEKNHYLVYGLAPIKVSDPADMAKGAKNYTVTIKHTFIDGLLNVITGGIYTPTTTIVEK